jgi:lipopolysaccharide export LptBFGC system permease protein LptF
VGADQLAKALRSGHVVATTAKDLFLKYRGDFVYIGRMDPSGKQAERVRVFSLNADGGLETLLRTPKATFDGKKWRLEPVERIELPRHTELGAVGYRRRHLARHETLEGFEPAILRAVFDGAQRYTVQDALRGTRLLGAEGVETVHLRTVLYGLFFFPLMPLFLIVLFFPLMPLEGVRGGFFWRSIGLVGLAVAVWGAMQLLFRIAMGGVVAPEYLVLPAVLAMAALSAAIVWRFWRERKI